MVAKAWRLPLLLAALPLLRADIDPVNFDPAVKPGDDFYHYADGGWLKTHPIPAAYSSWGAFYEVDDRNHDALHTILEAAAAAVHPSHLEKQVGDFYRSGMDEAAIAAAGLDPLRPELKRIDAIRSPADVQATIAHLHQIGVGAAFLFESEQDPKESAMMIGAGGQAGLGLPDQGYYVRTDEKSDELRKKYRRHIQRMFALAGESAVAAEAGANVVMTIEAALAKASKTNVELRESGGQLSPPAPAGTAKASPRTSPGRNILPGWD